MILILIALGVVGLGVVFALLATIGDDRREFAPDRGPDLSWRLAALTDNADRRSDPHHLIELNCERTRQANAAV